MTLLMIIFIHPVLLFCPLATEQQNKCGTNAIKQAKKVVNEGVPMGGTERNTLLETQSPESLINSHSLSVPLFRPLVTEQRNASEYNDNRGKNGQGLNKVDNRGSGFLRWGLRE